VISAVSLATSHPVSTGDSRFLPEHSLCTILKHCLRGLAELHNAPTPLVHLDIKPHNILFKLVSPSDGSHQIQYKLSDLGTVSRKDTTPQEEGDTRCVLELCLSQFGFPICMCAGTFHLNA
jgi:serine/threonine protein kinase